MSEWQEGGSDLIEIRGRGGVFSEEGSGRGAEEPGGCLRRVRRVFFLGAKFSPSPTEAT